MIEFSELPGLNAILNSITACLLISGFIFVRAGKVKAHKVCMVLALICAAAFLTSYLIYHYQMGATPFRGEGWIRSLYFTILISHTILAALVPPLAVITVVLAVRGRISQHRRLARFTLPIWLYVSVTGVAIYGMLYRL